MYFCIVSMLKVSMLKNAFPGAAFYGAQHIYCIQPGKLIFQKSCIDKCAFVLEQQPGY